MSDEQMGFPKKLKRYLPAGFEDKADSMPAEDINSHLIELEKQIAATEKDMEADIKLSDAKEMVKELAGTYREIIKQSRAMIRYYVYVMETRGA